MKETKLKAALFDLDGTLMDTEGQYGRFYGEIGRQFHPEMPDFANRIKGVTLERICELYFPEPAVREEVVRRLIDFEAHMDFILYPGALDFVRDLKEHGVRTAVVTSSTRAKLDKIAATVPGFAELFDRVLTSEDFSASKPDPACFNLGASIFGCSKDECVVFEDAFNGLAAGMASGIFTFGLATTNPRSAIADKCDCVLDSWLGFTYARCLELLR